MIAPSHVGQLNVAEGPCTTPPVLLMRDVAPVFREARPRLPAPVTGTSARGGEVAPSVGGTVGAAVAPPPSNPIPFLEDFIALGVGFFDNAGAPFWPGVGPPDTTGAVGLDHYVQMVNTSYAVFEKDTGTLLAGPLQIRSLFANSALGPDHLCVTNDDGDPSIVYDQLADRWVLSQFAYRNDAPQAYRECIAVSKTGDPLGQWNVYAFSYTDFNDYPQIAVWPDAYYVTYNMFRVVDGREVGIGPKVCALDRAAMLQGAPATQECRDVPGGPVILAGNLAGYQLPPAGSPAYFLGLGPVSESTGTATSLRFWKFRVNWATPSASTLEEQTPIPVAPYSIVCPARPIWNKCVAQPGVDRVLDSVGDRLMNRVVYRNSAGAESLVVSHTIVVGTGTDTTASGSGVRWYEIVDPSAASPVVRQQGTIGVDGEYRFVPSIASDRVGNIAVGYSVSSAASNVKPRISVSGRLANDPTNTMPQGETLLFQGAGVQTVSDRWGDYASMTVDPDEDCTFYFTSEYVTGTPNPTPGSGQWSTRVGFFAFPSCVQVPDFTIAASPLAAPVMPGASATSTVSTRRLGIGGTVALDATITPAAAGLTAAFASASIPAGQSTVLTVSATSAVAAGTYTVTVRGTEGAAIHSAAVTVTVGTPPDFTISASPATLSVAQGANGTSTVSVAATGAATTVALAATVAPSGAGVNAAVSPPSVATGATATLSVSATAAATPGSYTVTVTGTGPGGTPSHATTVAVTVPAPTPPAPTPSGGGGCSTGGEAAGSLLPLLVLGVALALRRGRVTAA